MIRQVTLILAEYLAELRKDFFYIIIFRWLYLTFRFS